MRAPVDATAYAHAERALAALLDTERDVTILQGEAILALEAVGRGLGGPGVRALNLVSGPYGQVLGEWLAAGGAEVTDLSVAFDRALSVAPISEALAAGDYGVVSVVHAEAATGVVNPLAEIAAAAHGAGAVLAVDAVASVGAEPLEIDAWDLDLVVLGPQKALAGPAGVSALVAGPRGWAQIAANPVAPRGSILSLLDWKAGWIDGGRRRIPGYAYEHEMHALQDALAALADDRRLARTVDRHRRAAAAIRAAAPALGLEPWVPVAEEAAGVCTLLRPPMGAGIGALVQASAAWLDGPGRGLVSLAPGPLADQALRVNHTGEGSRPGAVLAAVTALAGGLAALGYAPEAGAALSAAREALVPGS